MRPYDDMTFPEKLRHCMKQHRLSQEAVAESLDVSQNLVSRWSRGKNTPDIYQAKAIADMFGVTLDWLVRESDERSYAEFERERDARKIIDEIGWEEAYKRLVGVQPRQVAGPVPHGDGTTVYPPPQSEPARRRKGG